MVCSAVVASSARAGAALATAKAALNARTYGMLFERMTILEAASTLDAPTG
jgi:hypothetical protein